MPADPYLLLGVDPSADEATLKAAYRARIRACHPDLVAVEGAAAVAEAEASTKALNEAYDTIRRQRAQYGVPRPGAPPGPAVSASAPRRPAPPDLQEALRAARVAVGLARNRVQRWQVHARGLARANRDVLREQTVVENTRKAAEAALNQGRDARDRVRKDAAEAASRVMCAEIEAHARDAETASSQMSAAFSARAARSLFAAVNAARIGAGAQAADLAAKAACQATRRSAESAVRLGLRAGAAAERARVATRAARSAQRSLEQGLKDAEPDVEAALLAAALALGLATVAAHEATTEVPKAVAQAAVTEAAGLQDEATELERAQLTGEAVRAEAQARLEATRAELARVKAANAAIGSVAETAVSLVSDAEAALVNATVDAMGAAEVRAREAVDRARRAAGERI